MALSKSFQLSSIESAVRVLANEIAPDKVKSGTIKRLVNKNTLSLAEMLNGASAPDYGETNILSDAAASNSTVIALGATYTHSTRNVEKTGHGLTSADIGKRIVLVGTSRYGIAQIESITDANNFVTNVSLGANQSISYSVLPSHSTAYLDLTALKVDKVIKLEDSNNGLVSPAKDYDFENFEGIEDYENEVCYNHFGEKLHLKKGSLVSAWGTLTLWYYRLPVLVSASTDYIDVKDKYIPLLIDMVKLEVYEIANKLAPKELSESVTSKTEMIRNMNLAKEQTIAGKQK